MDKSRFNPGDRVYMLWHNDQGEEVARRWGTVKSAFPLSVIGKVDVDFDDKNPLANIVDEELLFKEGEEYKPHFYHYDKFPPNPALGHRVCPKCGRVGATWEPEQGKKKRYVHVTEGIMFSRDVDFCEVEATSEA